MRRILLFVFLAGLLYLFGCSSNAARSSSPSFNPYQGKLINLLPAELSLKTMKVKLDEATISDYTAGLALTDIYGGASEAKTFMYKQEVYGPQVTFLTILANYPTAAKATAKLNEFAIKYQAPITQKNNGQRFILTDGVTTGWTHGSLFCLLASSDAKFTVDFEQAAPY